MFLLYQYGSSKNDGSQPRDLRFFAAGPLTALRQSLVALPRRRAFFDASSFGLGGVYSNRFRPVEHAGERHEAQPMPNYSRARDPNPRHGMRVWGGRNKGCWCHWGILL